MYNECDVPIILPISKLDSFQADSGTMSFIEDGKCLFWDTTASIVFVGYSNDKRAYTTIVYHPSCKVKATELSLKQGWRYRATNKGAKILVRSDGHVYPCKEILINNEHFEIIKR